MNQILCCGLLLVAVQVEATPVLMIPPDVSVKPQSQLDNETNNDMAVFIPEADNRDDSLPQPFKAGPVVFRPHLNYQYSYAHGLLFAPSNAANSSINTIALCVVADLGRHWTLDYTPTVQVYSDKQLRNNVGHAVSLVGNVSYEDWVFGLVQTYVKSDATIVETASQTKQEVFGTSLTASHQLNEKFSTDLSLSQQITDVSGGQSTRSWSVQDWLNYKVAQRVFFGIGGTVGYVNVDIGPDQVSEELQARIQWRVTDKISFNVRGGLNYQQILDEAYSDPLSPVFGVDVQYAPFEQTRIFLSADRSVSSSQYYILGNTTEGTTVGLTLTQRLFEKYHFSTSLNYAHTDYTLTLVSISDVRSDDTYSFSASLNRTIFKRGSVGVSYQYGKNVSNRSGFGYMSNQIGLQASFAY